MAEIHAKKSKEIKRIVKTLKLELTGKDGEKIDEVKSNQESSNDEATQGKLKSNALIAALDRSKQADEMKKRA